MMHGSRWVIGVLLAVAALCIAGVTPGPGAKALAASYSEAPMLADSTEAHPMQATQVVYDCGRDTLSVCARYL